MRRVIGPPGIGDFLFVAQKLITQKEKFDWVFPVNNPEIGVNKNNVQTRAFQLEKLLPQIVNSTGHIKAKFERAVRGRSPKLWSETGQEIVLEANSWLESGKRIEEFLPDLETSFLLPFQTTEEDRINAALIIGHHQPYGTKYIGIYTSNHAKSRESWLEKEWVEMIKLIQNYNPSYKFVFIAAEYDRPLTESVMNSFDKNDYITCIDQELGTVAEVLKRLDIFISFQSGLSIMGELLGIKQTCMLYWNDDKHRNIIEAWPKPERIKSGQYKGAVFCEPQKIFDWLIDNKKL